MINKNLNTVLIVALTLTSAAMNSCVSQKTTSAYKNEVVVLTNTVNVKELTKYLAKDSVKQITLIQYYESPCACGVRSCASNALGINENKDTIRVFTMCSSLSNGILNTTYTMKRQILPMSEFSYGDISKNLNTKYPIYFAKLVSK